MPQINADALRHYRQSKNLTLDALADRSRVNRSTINKIEMGRRARPRALTLTRIADALGVEPSDLTVDHFQARVTAPPSSIKSQMNFRMPNDARNALNLTAMRYGVKASHILHLAPYLFRWAAEASLQWRSERLAEMERQNAMLSEIAVPRHLDGNATYNWRGEEILDQERRSISNRDLFGLQVEDEALPHNYEESEHNPMAQFLKTAAALMGDDVEFEHWSPHWSQPGYTLGMLDALALVGGDEAAAQHIVFGYAPLHELPKEIAGRGSAAIAEWANEVGQRYEDDIDLEALLSDMEDDHE